MNQEMGKKQRILQKMSLKLNEPHSLYLIPNLIHSKSKKKIIMIYKKHTPLIHTHTERERERERESKESRFNFIFIVSVLSESHL